MVGLSALAISVMGAISYVQSKAALIEASQHRITATLASRKTELDRLLLSVQADLEHSAANPQTVKALRAFKLGWRSLGEDPNAYLRDWYVAQNTAEEGRQNLIMADDRSRYSQAHRQHHEVFLSHHLTHGYEDILLLDLEGNVIYSVFKNQDFATNVTDGDSNAPLARLMGMIGQPDSALSTAFVVAPPVAGSPERCLVAKVVRDISDNRVGILVFALPTREIQAILDRRVGLEPSGAIGISPWQVIENLPESAAQPGAPMAIVSDGTLEVMQTLTFMGAQAMLTASEDMADILLPAQNLGMRFLILGVASLVLISGIAVLLARSLSGPLQDVGMAMSAVSESKFETEIPQTGRKDEIGDIATTLKKFKNALAAAKLETADAIFKGAAFEGSSAALMMTDRELKVTHVNAACRNLFRDQSGAFKKHAPNLETEDMLGADFDDFNALKQPAWQTLFKSENLPYHGEIAIDEARFSLNINSVSNAEDHDIGYVIEWQDVSQEQKNRAIVSTIMAQQCMAEFDQSGKLLNANRAFLAFANTPEGKLPQLDLADIFFNGDKGTADLVQLGRDGSPVFGRFKVANGGAIEGVLDGGLSPIVDVNGKVARTVLIARDITANENQLAKLDRDRRRLEAAQAKVVETLRIGLKSLANGDLTVSILEEFSEEYDELRLDFNNAANKLRGAVRRVEENANAILNETAEIAGAAEDLARRTETQAATLEETATALDELTTSVKSSAAGASQVSAIVDDARKKAEASGEVVAGAVQVMGEIEASSGQISKIINVIDDIAFQTNLLALNAGVEAARAGDAGRGFAVVATEVRALAQRSSNAAREISGLISKSGRHVTSGVAQVGQAGEALERIVTSVTEIAGHMSEIAMSAREQSNGLEEINSSVFQLDQVTQQNTAMFEETSAASIALRQEAEALTSTMAAFSTGHIATEARRTNPPLIQPEPGQAAL